MTNPASMTKPTGSKAGIRRWIKKHVALTVAGMLAIGAIMAVVGIIAHHDHQVKTAILIGKDSPDCHDSTVVEKGIKVLGPEVCTDHHTFYLYNGCTHDYGYSGYYGYGQLDMKIDDKLLNSALTSADKQSLANSGSIDGDPFASNKPSPNEYVVSYHPNWFTTGGKAFKITRFDHPVALANCKSRD